MKKDNKIPNIVKKIIEDKDFQRQYNTKNYIERTSFTKIMSGANRK